MFKLEDLKLVQKELSNNPSICEDGWHQSILCVGYKWLEDSNNTQKGYGDMITYMLTTFGELPALLILLGKYNYQVCNGGHFQYYDNGYASSGGGCFKNHKGELYLHQTMLNLMKKFGLHEHEIGSKVYQNACKMEVIEEKSCNCADGYEEDFEDENGDIYTEWGEGDDDCMCPMEWVVVCDDIIDDEYYSLDCSWMESIESGLVETLGIFKKAA